jgi:hypothetical protein
MNSVMNLRFLTEQLMIGEQLRLGRKKMLQPQDLPGRYGRVVHAVDHLLQIMDCEAVLGGGWAVWFHGFLGRITQDMDIVLPADRIEEFLQVVAESGFEVLPHDAGRWPKLRHTKTDVKVDIWPEGGRPGTTSKPAPTTIPHPSQLGAHGPRLLYVRLEALIALKLAAGRAKDDADVVEIIRVQPEQIDAIRQHLTTIHTDYVGAFDRLVERAREQRDE